MAKGRPRRLTGDDANETLKVSKEELARRRAEESMLDEFGKIRESPPHWLSYMAKIEWKRITPLMKELPISELDLTMLANYCSLYSHMRQLDRDLNKYGQFIINTYREGKETSRTLNPSFNAYIKGCSKLRSVCTHLGLNVNSRLKIVVPEEKEEEDQFMKLLRGG